MDRPPPARPRAARVGGRRRLDDPSSSDASQQFTPSGHVQREDTPDDPDYDQAEDPDPTTTNLYDERYGLFGFPSKHTALTARYRDDLRANGTTTRRHTSFHARS